MSTVSLKNVFHMEQVLLSWLVNCGDAPFFKIYPSVP